MNYNKRNNGYDDKRTYNHAAYDNGGYGNQGYGGYGPHMQGQKQRYKTTGTTWMDKMIDRATGEVKQDHDGSDLVGMRGWNKRRGSFIASPHRDLKKRQCANGSEVWMVKVTSRRGKVYWTLGFWNPKTQKLSMPEMTMVATLKGEGVTRSGKRVTVYWGTSVMKSRR